MQTDDLIKSLSGQTLAPVGPRFAARRIGTALAVSAAVVMAIVVVQLGLRSDLATAMRGTMFWLKLGFAASVLIVALWAGAALRRPEAKLSRATLLLFLPFALMALGGFIDSTPQTPEVRMIAWLGQSWRECSLLIAGLSLPIFGALVLAFRRFAPTRPTATGGLLGIASGAAAACLYSLHCPEASLAFVATWYALGILIAGAVGVITGSRLLRW